MISRKQDHIVSMGNNYHKCQSKYLIAVGVLRSELNLVRRATSEAISNMQCLLQEFSDKSVNYALNHLKSGMLQQEQKHLQEQQALVLALQVAIPSTVDVSTDTLELSLDAEEDFKLSIARLSEERNDLALMVENLRESKQKSDHLASHQAACCDQLQTNALILSNQCKILEESHLLEIAKMSGAFEHQLAIRY